MIMHARPPRKRGKSHSIRATLGKPVKRAKVRLQFTGWLQYLPTAVAALVFLALSVGGRCAGVWPAVLFWLPCAVGTLLLAAVTFDVITVKMGVRPSEPKPPRKDDLDTFDVILSRRSCRSFQRRNLTSEDRDELFGTALEASRPSQLIGTNPIRFEYVSARLTVWPTVGAHEFFVAIAPCAYDRQSVIDVGRSLHKVVLQATRMGVATCWIGPGADQASVVAALGDRFDPAEDHVICICAVGYWSHFKPLLVRAIEIAQHRRLPLASLFLAAPEPHAPLPVDMPPFSAFQRCYEACRWSPSAINSQATRCVGVTDETGRNVTRFDFWAVSRSRFYAPVALGIWCANWEAGCEELDIPGHFEALEPGSRGEAPSDGPAKYGVSWIVDSDRALTA
ncbi:nitroreductase family protein [Streptomyces sp. NPDC060030]|uniref:nitroreductase family protein n=1 Tax=Streptomyces sp. NPDC060030 TaxID=3347042 RepID=UPI00368CF498